MKSTSGMKYFALLREFSIFLAVGQILFLEIQHSGAGSKPSRSGLHGFHNAPQPVLL